MEHDPADALREQAREWGRALLATAPWSTVSDRVALLLMDPPAGVDDAISGSSHPAVAFWLTLDAAAARSLPDPYGTALASDRPVVERPRSPGDLQITLSVLTDEALHRFLQGTNPAALEARWQIRHHEAVSDRLRRGEQYRLRAGLLPDDAPERISRTLFLDLVRSTRALARLESRPAELLAAAGEATAAVCRLACFDDGGAYPPSEYLRIATRETRLGRRLGPWLDDVVRAIGGDEAAARRSTAASTQVVEEARTVLGERYRDRLWLRTPEAFALRAPR